ncbi:WD domain, G-beta repeat-containing protein [Toxoplasma gondii GAB2-2007-GAL-DOM2]|uniref:WD domain, G-beta repeat-containing protein n=5 Tax=Toxoplasma gondii TaxID=5811 RepID=S7VY82_TOXGG|nr:WD domain, G-beta repeat-containing protein [Toxoplasma gondii GT1]KAF4644351.1 WD domain, G-beta repeat-containing protein [Toxoplasma gondii]KFG42822.1 WD domain, G-beta repeat-containing protein [Toxoplasma gondii GAB2-2007-GAL-DOM2]KFG53207.1 WD domain, G-beta repeat-containing protein [Toxoplasma gondii FOU]RQX73858.1 WD domain, G-beta repeat-containing protein [Toxoplasma gondii CAST]
MSRQRIRETHSCEILGPPECCVDSPDISTAVATNIEIQDPRAKAQSTLDLALDDNVQAAATEYICTVPLAKTGEEYGFDSGVCPSTAETDFQQQNRGEKKEPATVDASDTWLSPSNTGEVESSDPRTGVIDNDDSPQPPITSQNIVPQSSRVTSFDPHCLPHSSCHLQEAEAPVSEPIQSRRLDPVYLQSYSFNQDNTCFVCATSVGFRVFTCAPLSEFMRREVPAWGEGCYEVAGMLFRTNVFALVSQADPKKVKLWDDQKRLFIGEVRARQAVKNICLGREILAVVTEYSIYIYQSEQMRPFNIIHTGANPRGLCIIAAGRERDHWIVGCPAIAAGAVRIQTSEGERKSHVFQAHQSALAALSFNAQGTWIATASETGTVIRVFATLTGQLLHELRRGTHSYAISCIALRADGLFLAVASSSPTVHIFKLDHCGDVETRLARTKSGTAEHLQAACTFEESMNVSRRSHATSPDSSVDVHSGTTFGQNTLGTGSALWSASEGDSYRAGSSGVPLQQALSVGKELTAVVYDASKEIVHDAIKGVLPRYFSAVRSFAQFHVPTDQQSIDVRARPSRIVGPLCAFAGERSNHLYLLHPNGVFYEFRFDPNYGDECTLLTATTWFAPRADFQIQSRFESASLPSELEGGHEGDDWQIVM